MRAVVQRVRDAAVTVDGVQIAKIGRGLVALVAISREDSRRDLEWMAKKIVELRIFDDSAGKLNLGLGHLDLVQHGRVLLVGLDGHELILEPGKLGPHQVYFTFRHAPPLCQFLAVRDLILVILCEELQFILEDLNLGGNIDDLLLQASDLLINLLEGDQVSKIGIHLSAPSDFSRPGGV